MFHKLQQTWLVAKGAVGSVLARSRHDTVCLPLRSPFNKKLETNFKFCFKKSVPFPSDDMRSLTPWDKLFVMLHMSNNIVQLLGGVPASRQQRIGANDMHIWCIRAEQKSGDTVKLNTSTLSIFAPYSPSACLRPHQSQTIACAADVAHSRVAEASADAVLTGLAAVC